MTYEQGLRDAAAICWLIWRRGDCENFEMKEAAARIEQLSDATYAEYLERCRAEA